jgi:hypothetical protein
MMRETTITTIATPTAIVKTKWNSRNTTPIRPATNQVLCPQNTAICMKALKGFIIMMKQEEKVF